MYVSFPPPRLGEVWFLPKSLIAKLLESQLPPAVPQGWQDWGAPDWCDQTAHWCSCWHSRPMSQTSPHPLPPSAQIGTVTSPGFGAPSNSLRNSEKLSSSVALRPFGNCPSPNLPNRFAFTFQALLRDQFLGHPPVGFSWLAEELCLDNASLLGQH